MSEITKEDVKYYEKNCEDYIKYKDQKAKFNSNILKDMKHNGEIVEVLGLLKGRDIYHDRYVVRFNDDTIDDNILTPELEFDFIRDPVQENTRKILSKIIKKYDLSNQEIEELKVAIINYDYEINEGLIITNLESIEKLFTEEDSDVRINPSENQLKAMAEFIKETKKFYDYDEYTKKVVDSILSKNEKKIMRLEILNEIKDIVNQNITRYSSDLGIPKKRTRKRI